LRGLGGKALSCGCLVGTYETYDGDVVTIVDARGGACADRAHQVHAILPEPVPMSTPRDERADVRTAHRAS
jgi:hypothetical protein